jgi:2-polyprenyl-3-methyl-5-hydroxy-6-metoxy-1,4-benzoquinol methylase
MLACHLDGSSDVSSRNTAFIDRSAAWITARFGLGARQSVADFGCGPGLYARRLAASGADVTGVDFSERSLRHARECARADGLPVDYVCANYLEFESDQRFDLITLIMCDLCALGPDQRRTLLEKFLAHLKPGGAVLLDVYSLSAFAAKQEQATYAPNLLDGFWSPAPYFGFLNTFKYAAEHVVLDKYTIVEEERVRVVYNWLQHFSVESVTAELDERGFVVDEVLGDVAGASWHPAAHEFAIVARKCRG